MQKEGKLNNEESKLTDWAKLSSKLESLLRLKTSPVAYKKLDKKEELDMIPGLLKLERKATFCQAPSLARAGDMIIGVTRDNFGARCARINGLLATTEEQTDREAVAFATSWFATVEDGKKQMAEYPLIPPGEAVVLAPLSLSVVSPDVILVYGNPAQMMFLMNGLQHKDYERFHLS